jgi:TatD DNase family protein
VTLCDSHAHLDGSEFAEDRDQVIARARAAGVERMLLIGLWRKPGDFGNSLQIQESHPGLFGVTFGVHPHDCAQVPPEDWERLSELAAGTTVNAVGETGLDYHYDHSPRDVQRHSFERQLALAAELGKPVSVHLREAQADSLAILTASGIGRGPGGVIHCFSGDANVADRYLDLGLYLSISGIVTFRNATTLQDAVRHIPLDRLLIETDAPFLAPIPFRGKRNEPAHVKLVAEKIAELKGIPADEVAATTTRNAERLFQLR